MLNQYVPLHNPGFVIAMLNLPVNVKFFLEQLEALSGIISLPIWQKF